MAALGKCESPLRFDFESSTQDVEASDRDSGELPDYCKTRIKMLIDEEVLMAVARDSAFRRDFRSVIRAVAERRLAHGVPATWQLVREIREEAIADLSLASRWPAAMIEALALDDTTAVPPLDGNPTANEPDDSSDVVRAVIVVLSERSAGGVLDRVASVAPTQTGSGAIVETGVRGVGKRREKAVAIEGECCFSR